MRSRAALLLLVAGSLGISPGAWPAADPPAVPAPDLFGERIDVSVVNLEVYVTDAKGNAVHGLGEEDFTLLEDGKPVEITNFSAVSDGAVAAVAGESAQVEGTAPAAPALLPPELRLNLIVYVDNVHLQPSNRKRAFAKLADFLAKAPAGTRLMVVSTEPGLRVAVPPTEKVADVLAGLDALAKSRSVGTEGYVARLNTIRSIRSIYESDGCSEIALDLMKATAMAYVKPKYHDEAAALGNLSRFVGTLAGIPGRKVLLHLSDGIPLVAGQEVSTLIAQLCGGETVLANSEFSLVNPLRRLSTQANGNGVTFYTLEAAGLRNLSSSSAEFAGASLDAELDFEDQANHQDTLFNLASETGGRAILNTNRLEIGLAQVADDLANYYSLGYMPHQTGPRQTGDGKPRALAVRVRGEGLTARFRKSYRDKPARERAEERVLASLLLGTGANPLGAQLEIGAATPAGKDQFLVPLRLRLPLGRLTLLPKDDRLAGQLALQMVVRDEEGQVSPLRTVAVEVNAAGASPDSAHPGEPNPPGANATGAFVYEIKMTMRKGAHRLALGIEDVPSAVASYLAFDFAVPSR